MAMVIVTSNYWWVKMQFVVNSNQNCNNLPFKICYENIVNITLLFGFVSVQTWKSPNCD